MPDYNFQTLNDREFERLGRDLLQRELDITMESFKPGRDGGIDLRHSSPEKDLTIIVQAKHRTRSDYTSLLRDLKKEAVKVNKLNPSRYILITSTEFNPAQKNEILKLFTPFILSTGDILGRDDVNGLLVKFPDVEGAHPKLWLASVPVLTKIINNGVRGRSDFTEDVIRRNVSLYVANQTYADALEILNLEHFLIIIGEPGIGKTVLAKMLIYQMLGNDYKLVSVTEKISEAEDLWESEQRQAFYFDDFLGANYLEIAQYHNGDSAMVNFIARVKADPLKRLILTSRTAVLNQAAQVYPRLETPELDLARHEVRIDDYSDLDKAQILYNHLYFLGLGDEYKQKIKEDKNYWKIIKHENFNPRLIEFITDPIRTGNVAPDGYIDFINTRLDNPADIWRQAYQNQTDEYGKFLIQSLFSLGEKVSEQLLKRAFQARLDYEIQNNGFRREADVFAIRLKHLMGGFLKAERDSTNIYFSFFNPSVVDFLLHFLNEAQEEKWRILNSTIFTSQLLERFASGAESLTFSTEELDALEALVAQKEETISTPEPGSKYIELLNFYIQAFPSEILSRNAVRIIERMDFNEATTTQSQTLLSSLETLIEVPLTHAAIKARFREVANYLFSSDIHGRRISKTRRLFKEYAEDYEFYIADENSRAIVESTLTRHWAEFLNDVETGQDTDVNSFYDSDGIETYLDEVYTDGMSFNKALGFPDLNIMSGFNDIDYEEAARASREQAQIEDHLSDYHKEEYYESRIQERDEKAEIDDLFQ